MGDPLDHGHRGMRDPGDLVRDVLGSLDLGGPVAAEPKVRFSVAGGECSGFRVVGALQADQGNP
jgi:hypothetical protein